MTQATELNFIIQAKDGTTKQYRNLMKFPCGLRQKHYNNAYKQAQDTLTALEQQGLRCRLITKYLKTYIPNNFSQLHFV